MAQTLVLIERPADVPVVTKDDPAPTHGWTAETLAAALADSLVMHLEARGLI